MHFTGTSRARVLAVKPADTVNRILRYALLAGLTAAAASGTQQTAVAQVPSTPIAHCGAVISAPGLYTVTQALESSSLTEDCIAINSSGVVLSIGAPLTGPGGSEVTAAGIRIATHTSGVQVIIDAAQVEDFGVGIVIQGSGVSIVNDGDPNTPTTIDKNAAQGILISGATNVLLQSLVTTANGAAGIEIANSTGVTVLGYSESYSNGSYGLWVHSSSSNQFFNLEIYENKLGGIYIGESAPNSPSVKSNTEFLAFGNINASSRPVRGRLLQGEENNSSQNVFIGGSVIENGSGGKGYGIVIGKGDVSNIVTIMGGQQNPSGDAVDENGNCTENSWSKNQFHSISPSCIH
jgi:hypothetical protein